MGLFTRRRTAAATWEPEIPEIDVADIAEMADDGAEGTDAYGAALVRDDVPASTLTIWTYAACAADEDPAPYMLGHRYEYTVDNGPQEASWAKSLYGPGEPDFFDDLDDAQAAARANAEYLVTAPAGTIPLTHADHLDWDGVPW